jgi:hypothetical protein
MNPQPPSADARASTPEFAEPAPGDRFKIACAAAALFVGLALVHLLAVRPTLAWVRTLPGCEQATWLSGLLVGAMALVPLVGGGVFLPTALRVFRQGRMPPSGTWLWRRTRVWRGRRARWIAGLMIAWTAAAIPVPFFAWQIIAPLQSRACPADMAAVVPPPLSQREAP